MDVRHTGVRAITLGSQPATAGIAQQRIGESGAPWCRVVRRAYRVKVMWLFRAVDQEATRHFNQGFKCHIRVRVSERGDQA